MGQHRDGKYIVTQPDVLDQFETLAEKLAEVRGVVNDKLGEIEGPVDHGLGFWEGVKDATNFMITVGTLGVIHPNREP